MFSFTLSSLLVLSYSKYIAADTISDIIDAERSSEFTWKASRPYGGMGGEYFTDWWTNLDGTQQRPNQPPDQINIRSGGRVDSIQMMYASYNGLVHGGQGGLLARIRLYNGDRIVRVSGRSGIGPGSGIDQITLHTKNGRTFGPYGGTGGVPFDVGIPREGCFLGYISGRAARRLDQLILHWRCLPEYRIKQNTALYGYSQSTSKQHLGSPVLIFIIFVFASLYSAKTNTLVGL